MRVQYPKCAYCPYCLLNHSKWCILLSRCLLLKCDLYNDIRLPFLSAIHLHPNFINFDDNEKFLFLMTEKGLTTILAKSVHNMFLKRFS